MRYELLLLVNRGIGLPSQVEHVTYADNLKDIKRASVLINGHYFVNDHHNDKSTVVNVSHTSTRLSKWRKGLV